MEEHINETAAKRGAGRPEVDNRAVFDEIMRNPDTRKQLVKQFAHLVTQRKLLLMKQDGYKDDVKATKEAFGLNGSFITQAVDAIVKDKADKKREESSQFADFLQILQEGMESTEDDEEWKDED